MTAALVCPVGERHLGFCHLLAQIALWVNQRPPQYMF